MNIGQWSHEEAEKAEEWLTDRLGGPARRRVIILLACVLALSTADSGATGALAAYLEGAFKIGNTQFGLLLTISSGVGAIATLPMGVLADRYNRVRLLIGAIVLWAAAMVATSLSVSYLMLLFTRMALGAVVATAGPVIASLTGDLFPSSERSRIYSFILTGELVGAGLGLVVVGDVGAAAGWRAAYLTLVPISAALAYALHRWLPEPARGGQSRLPQGVEAIPATPECPEPSPIADDEGGDEAEREAAARLREEAAEEGIRPDDRLVLRRRPETMGAWSAAVYILRIPSNRVLIAASALGYFFLAGLRTFAELFARAHYSLSQGVVSTLLLLVGAGAVAGVLIAGRLTDSLIGRGRSSARMVVAGISLVVTAAIFVPGIVLSNAVAAIPFLVIGAAFLAAPNSAIDAARLDVVPGALWGRGEAVRTFIRNILEAAAPLLFGYVSSLFGGAEASIGAGVNSSHRVVSAATARGLEYTFLIMLIPLAASGGLLLWRRRTYLGDVVTAGESEERIRETAPAD